MADASDKKSGEAEKEAAPATSGGIKMWLPLIVTIITMPALAFATARFVILPKLQHSMGKPSEAETKTEGGEAPAEKEKHAGNKNKVMVPLTKMLVNISGTMGTRYLLTSVTLVSSNADFKSKVEENRDQLMDLATGALSTKTISDLEKPGARNVIRAELTSVLNTALGSSMIQEIYITELAIQ